MVDNSFVRTLDSKLRALQKKERDAREVVEQAQNKHAQVREQINALQMIIAMESPGPIKRNSKQTRTPAGTLERPGRPAPVQDALLKILLSEKNPIRVKVILSKLHEQQVPHSPTSIPTMLRRLEGRGVVRRVGYGRYQSVDNITGGDRSGSSKI